MTNYQPDHQQLINTAKAQMPYGKYKGRFLSDIPEPYLVWMSQKGFPDGKLGEMLALVYEMKINGLEHLLRKIRSEYP
jgi:uncharacterized protein (DUF3820 family)